MWTRARNVRAIALVATLSVVSVLGVVVVRSPDSEVHAQGAAVDFFLKIDGIEGESTHEEHRGEIEILSWSWGASNSTSAVGGGGGSGKANFQDLSLTKSVDKATPKLMLYCAQGRHIPSATLTVRRGTGTFMKIEMSNVFISSFKVSGDRATGAPVNEVRLRFSRVVITQFVQNSDGTTSEVKAGYDLATNKKV